MSQKLEETARSTGKVLCAFTVLLSMKQSHRAPLRAWSRIQPCFGSSCHPLYKKGTGATRLSRNNRTGRAALWPQLNVEHRKPRVQRQRNALKVRADVTAERDTSETSKLRQFVPKAIIFDCDGVLVESEELHRVTYNETFDAEGLSHIQWSQDYYEILQNKIGGGKEKYLYHFQNEGWPTPEQCGFDTTTPSGREALIQHLHQSKSARYAERIRNDDSIRLRPGVGEIIDTAHKRGIRLAICSASNRESVEAVLKRILSERPPGASRSKSRFEMFEFIIAGDSVPKKKPDPLIYEVALERLGVAPSDCLVIEDSAIGLAAARGAGIRCVITYTWYTKSQSFDGATAIFGELDGVSLDDILDAVTVSSN
jgi:beta-phosphoglucomutase-like phosphatase (HAD superfamily)